jgi:hypothetical protein
MDSIISGGDIVTFTNFSGVLSLPDLLTIIMTKHWDGIKQQSIKQKQSTNQSIKSTTLT